MPKYPIPEDRLIRIFPEYSPIKIKYKDIFDMKDFYKAIHNYLTEREWADPDGDGNKWETYYGERVDQSGVREGWVWWRPTKIAKDASYLRYHIDIDYHIIGMKPTEIVQEGKKFKTFKLEVEIIIRAYIEELYKEKFDKEKGLAGAILKGAKNIFANRIYSGQLDQHKKFLYQQTYALQHFMKQWLKLKRYLPYEQARLFYQSKAYPSHTKQ